jgi:hypothetical protein
MKVVRDTVSDSCPLEFALRLLEASRWKNALLCEERRDRILVCVANKRKHGCACKRAFRARRRKGRDHRGMCWIISQRVRQVDFESQ